MDLLTFITKCLENLTWPVTLFILILLIRKPLRELIPFLKRARLSELEIEFDRDLEEVSLKAQNEFQEKNNDWRIALIELSDKIPTSAVTEAWKEVETRVKELIKLNDPSVVVYSETRYKDMQEIMESRQLLDNRKIKIYDDLRQIRNKVSHAKGYDLTKNQAHRYVTVAIQLTEYLESKIREFH